MAKKVNREKMGSEAIESKDKFIKSVKGFTIEWLCKNLSISRSGYYKRLKKKANSFNDKIEEYILECFKEVKGIYGRLRITEWIKENKGIVVNHKRVYRLMKKLGLQSVIRKKKYKRKYTRPEIVRENHLKRDFVATQLNQKWSVDVSYIPVENNKFIYLFAIKDLFNNEIIDYSLASTQNLKQVLTTIDRAIEDKNVSNLIIHSDQGFQFTSKKYIKFLENKGITVSHSRRGNCLDNSPIECFFGHLKSEYKYLYSTNNKEEIIDAVEKYIDFYNNKRIQLKLKSYSPILFRTIA